MYPNVPLDHDPLLEDDYPHQTDQNPGYQLDEPQSHQIYGEAELPGANSSGQPKHDLVFKSPADNPLFDEGELEDSLGAQNFFNDAAPSKNPVQEGAIPLDNRAYQAQLSHHQPSRTMDESV